MDYHILICSFKQANAGEHFGFQKASLGIGLTFNIALASKELSSQVATSIALRLGTQQLIYQVCRSQQLANLKVMLPRTIDPISPDLQDPKRTSDCITYIEHPPYKAIRTDTSTMKPCCLRHLSESYPVCFIEFVVCQHILHMSAVCRPVRNGKESQPSLHHEQ